MEVDINAVSACDASIFSYFFCTDQSKIYHCPNRKCRRPFRDLADVVNHLESEKCGFIKYHEIRKKLPDIVRGNKWISF